MSSIPWLNSRAYLTSTIQNKGLRRGIAYLTSWQLGSLLTASYLIWLVVRFAMQPEWLDKLPISVTEAMELAEIGRGITLAFLWGGIILRNYLRNRPRKISQLTYETLVNMDQDELVRCVSEMFKDKGYRVARRGHKGSRGIDLELTNRSGERAIVICRSRRGAVGESEVRYLFGTLLQENAVKGFLVTTGDISKPAWLWAMGKPITVISGKTLLNIAASMKGSTRS
ncbi:MAG: restriction endonuclease [Candidatus Promineifilaceae bacterium]